jgi:hypothetical protein
MSLQDITITGSIGSIATQSYGQRIYVSSTDEQSFPIETITGSQAGVWPNFTQGTNYTVDLIVNVTQSWSGSNITPLGIVPFIHDTMDEFINGEFSGSNYVVTDGNLNDAQCEQFLTVNTIPTSYSVFPYSVYRVNGTVQGTSQFGVFINNLTAPPNGGILLFKEDDDFSDVPPTVKYVRITYIKVSRFDKEGNDNTLSLQELTSIRWTDSEPTVGEIILNVLNITEYPTYYLYAVLSKTFVNPTFIPGDDNTLNYSLSASFTGTSASAGLYYLNQWNVINSSGGTFDTFYYTFNVTPNITTRYTASITAQNNNASPVTFDFGFVENAYAGTEISFTPIAQTQSVNIPAGQTRTFTLSGSTNSSFIGNPNVQYHLETNNLNAPISLSNTFWIVTHSIAPQTSTSSVVIEPYLLSNFTNSDCDVLMNNYSESDYSKFYREVLYDNGGIIPSNLKQIISGTAQYAELNDYLYNASANVLPRYKGVRTTSAGFNLPSQNGFTNEQLSIIPISSDLTIDNGTPNVENTTTYFGYFTSLKSNNPIFKGTTSPILKYLIREDGEVFNPAADEAAYYNIIDSFPRGTKAYTNLLFDTTVTFNSTQSILLSGESYTPILYNIDAANNISATFTSSINFNNLQGIVSNVGTPPSYSFYIQDLNNSLPLTQGIPMNLFYEGRDNSPFIDPSNSWSGVYLTPDIYEPNYGFDGTPQNYVRSIVKIDGAQSNFGAIYNTLGFGSNIIRAKLWRSNGTTSSSIAQKDSPVFGGFYLGPYFSGAILNFDYTFIPNIGDSVFLTVELLGCPPGTTGGVVNFSWKLETLGIAVPTTSAPFWFTGSASGSTITASADLTNALLGNYIQQDIEGSGFDPFQLPCTIQVDDEFRFEYDESNVFKVVNIQTTGSQLVYVLDKNIPNISSLNINHFLVRRKIKDYITGITLDSSLISQINEGFLLPEYPSTDLKNNLSKIINDLSQKNVI